MIGHAVLVGKDLEAVPGGVLDENPFREIRLRASMFDLAGVEDLFDAGRGRCRLEIVGEVRHLALEVFQVHERIDPEDGHEHAVVVFSRGLDAEPETGQDSGEDLDHCRKAETLVTLGSAERQLDCAVAELVGICRRVAVLIAGHMNHLGFSGREISYVFGTTAFGSLISPVIAGWIADRFLPNQVFTAMCHFAGAPLLFLAWHQTLFFPLWLTIFFYAMLYMPTIALTNAIAFHHTDDSRAFGTVRAWGTIGWIAIAWVLSLYLGHRADADPTGVYLGDCLLFAAGLSAVMGVYCLTLPHTPPSPSKEHPYAFLEAFNLSRNRNFATLLVVSFVVAIELPFYYNLTFLFLTEPEHGVGLTASRANLAMSLGQVGEVALMLLLAPSIKRLGTRGTIVLGILAWPVRYAIFAIGRPAWLIIAAQGLHGICYSFFFVGGMIAVERLSRRDIRASAQGLIVFATNGVGMLVGHFFSGQVHDYFAMAGGHDWTKIFLVPIAITLAAAVAFFKLFDERLFVADAAAIEVAEA